MKLNDWSQFDFNIFMLLWIMNKRILFQINQKSNAYGRNTKHSYGVLSVNNKSVQNSAQLRKLLRLFPLFYKKTDVFFCSIFCSIVLNKSTGLFKIRYLSEHLSHFLTWHAPFFWTIFFRDYLFVQIIETFSELSHALFSEHFVFCNLFR